jgi:tryptophan 2,3-dioxygenase
MTQDLSPKTQELLQKLQEKFGQENQKLDDYLEGLLYNNYEPYWRYVAVDTLLSLQQPKTDIPDEVIFIGYHQITELYFKLIIHELEQMSVGDLSDDRWKDKLTRVVRYFKNLIDSFDIMIDGMEMKQFLEFRMSLLPASGFQSAQFRMIEMACTDMFYLTAESQRENSQIDDVQGCYQNIYWKQGSIDSATGQRTLTLKQFEDHYEKTFMEWADKWKNINLNKQLLKLDAEGKLTEELKGFFKTLDVYLNINWRLSHYRSAVRYLSSKGTDVSATGGTNWQKFLPPRFQRIISFPTLWTEEEKENWGKGWVDEQMLLLKK